MRIYNYLVLCYHVVMWIIKTFAFQGSLIANMVMGVIILKKKYTLDKFISVGMITAGITICTIVSGQDVVSDT